MRSAAVRTLVVLAAALAVAAVSAAQEPVRSFDQLDTRLKPGDTVWVTDAGGREVKGKIASLAADALTLNGGAARTFSARDVMRIQQREHDSLANGAIIGLAVGGGSISVLCLASARDDDEPEWCWLGAAVYAGVGAGIGVAIDALVPGKKLVVYRAPAATSAKTRLSIAPVVGARTKGVELVISF